MEQFIKIISIFFAFVEGKNLKTANKYDESENSKLSKWIFDTHSQHKTR